MKSNPVVIIGGGVIGLTIGWHLAREGTPTILFEKKTVGSGASLAAAGMITPASEVRFGEEALLELFLRSLEDYPSFVSSLERSSNIKVDFHKTGSLMIAIDQDDEAELLRLYDYQRELNLPVSLLTPSEVHQREPLLSSQFKLAIESKTERFLDNRLLLQALKIAYTKAGGVLIENRLVNGVRVENNQITQVLVENEVIQTSQVVLASGIDIDLEGLPKSLKLPIRPVKGQALEVKNNRGGKNHGPVLQRAVRTLHRYPVYLVPRSDGRLLIGATNEEQGLDQRVTAGAMLDLLYGAWKILPSIDEMEVIETWTGHRPTTSDHSPILGPTKTKGLTLAMGMYRHGILLAPVVGQLIANFIIHHKTSPFFESFGESRFEGEKK